MDSVGWLRRATDGLGIFIGVASGFFLFALLSFLLLLQSPNDKIQWVGHKQYGVEREGLVDYSWRGVNYTLDVNGFGNRPRVAVRFYPDDPSEALRDSMATRITDLLLTGLPAAIGLGLLGFGVAQRSVRSRRLPDPAGFGTGLDPEFVQRQIENLRRGPT